MGVFAGDRSVSYGYSGFQQVRNGIAKAIGIEDRAEYYAEFFNNDSLMGFWHDPETATFPQDVKEPADDIDYLMLHQDCEGVLFPWCAKRVADRLRDIIVHIEDDSVWPTFNTKRMAVELLDLLDYAYENGELVTFS